MQEKTKLTEKQERFCQEYVTNGGNGSKAVRDAGYAAEDSNSQCVEAFRLLRNANIIARIAELRSEIGDRFGITAEEIVNGFREITKRGLQAEEVVTRKGEKTGIYQSDLHAAARAYEGLANIAGINAPKKIEDVTKRPESLSDEERKTEIRSLIAELVLEDSNLANELKSILSENPAITATA